MPFSLGANLVPGTYQVCEAIPGPAWNMSMNLDPTAFMPNVDTGATLCVPVTLAAGDNLSLSFDNSPPPGGIALTIGYVALLGTLGFFIDTVLYIAALTRAGRYRRWSVITAVSFGGALVFMFIFMKVVYLSLPIGRPPFASVSLLLMQWMGIR